MTGLTHGLLGGVGRAVQVDAHQAEHHVAAGADGQVDVHPAGVAHGRVGDDGAGKAPFVAQDVGQQGAAGAGPGVADVAVAGHDGGRAALLDRQLKGFEINFADGLFVGPDAQRQAVGFLVVEGEVLDIGVDALAHAAADFGSGQLAGKQAVLGIILKVAAAEGGTVDVGAGGVQAGHMVGGGFRAQRLAEAFDKFLVPGRADDGLRGEAHALEVAGQAVDAGGAVQLGGGGFADALGRRGGPAAVRDHIGHILDAQLLQQLLPLRIVVIEAGHILQRQAVVGDGDGRVAVVDFVDRRFGKEGDGLGAGFLVGRAGGGQGAFPVGAGDIPFDLAGRDVVELVDGGGAVAGAGVVGAVDDRLVHRVIAAVNDVVRVRHQLDLIVAGFQHIAAVFKVVVGGHVLDGKTDGHRLARARLQQAGLAKAGQHHMAFFDAALGVGGGVVDLHDVLAGRVAGVGHLDLHRDGGLVGGKIGDGLFKRGVGKAVAEGILHHRPVRLLVADAGGIVDPAGLVETVADVDALGVLEVVAVFQIGIGEHARVPVRGRGGQVIRIGVGQPAGGVDRAGQHLAHRVHAGRARRADPQRGVDALFLQKAQLHRVGGVQQHNDLVKVLLFHQRQQVFLIPGQFQIMAAVVGIAVTGGVHILGQVVALAAGAGEHDHRHAGEFPRRGHQLVGVLAGGHLGGGEVRAGKPGAFRPADAGIAVEVDEFLVDGEPGVGQAGDEVDVVRVIAGTAARPAKDRVDAGIAEEVDGLALGQGQGRVLVFQQDDALALQLPRHIPAGLLGLVRRQRQRLDAGVFRARQAGVQIGRHKGVDGRKEHAAGNVGDERDDGQNGHDHHGQAPFGCFLFHSASPYCCLVFPLRGAGAAPGPALLPPL